jgi:hypothetical protein
MWKPVSAGDGVDAATMMAALKALENSLLNLNNVVCAQRVRGMIGASVLVGGVCFVTMCMVLYNKA